MVYVHMQIVLEEKILSDLLPGPRTASSVPLRALHVTTLLSTSHPRARTVAQSHCRLQLQASCLSSPPPRRSARPPPAVASLPRPRSWAAAPRCTWRSRAGPASRPARSGASRSAAARSAAAGSRPPTRTRTPRRRGRAWSGRGSRWGSRCRRSRCRTCRTRSRSTSGRGPSGISSASSFSTCGLSASFFSLVACGFAVATYNDGATDFRDTPSFKESITQEFPEEAESSGSDVFEGNPTEVAPALE